MKKYLTCEEIIQKLDTRDIKFKIDGDLNLRYKNNKCSCPNPDHEDKNPSCIYNYDKKKYYCFSCDKSYSLFDHYILFYKCKDINEAKDLINKDYNLKNVPVKATRQENKPRLKEKQYRTPKNIKCFGDLNKYTLKYFENRGITKYSLDVLEIKQYTDTKTHIKASNIIVVPIYDIYKNHISNKYRDIKTKCFNFDKDTNTKSLINIQNTSFNKTLYITEGETDLLTLLELFKFKKNTNVVSVPVGANGLQWIDYNKDLLKRYSKIIICFDNDEIGKINQIKAIKKLFGDGINTNVYPLLWLGRKEKDINEVFNRNKEYLKEMIIKTHEKSTITNKTALDNK